MRLEEQLNILIESIFILFDGPEIISMGLDDHLAECATIKHGIATDHNSP